MEPSTLGHDSAYPPAPLGSAALGVVGGVVDAMAAYGTPAGRRSPSGRSASTPPMTDNEPSLGPSSMFGAWFDDLGAQVRFYLAAAATVANKSPPPSPPLAPPPPDEAAPPRRRGRPKLGVVGREVTLLPRHWAWLETQRASILIR